MNHRQLVGLSQTAAMTRASVGIFLIIAPAIANAQDAMHRESPQSAVQSFLASCKAGDYSRGARYLDLRNLPQGDRRKSGPDLRKRWRPFWSATVILTLPP